MVREENKKIAEPRSENSRGTRATGGGTAAPFLLRESADIGGSREELPLSVDAFLFVLRTQSLTRCAGAPFTQGEPPNSVR